jgi:hypothetical protein
MMEVSYIIIDYLNECAGAFDADAGQQRGIRLGNPQVTPLSLRLDFVKKPLVATMSEVPLHLAPPVQEISQENFQPSVEEEVIEVTPLPRRVPPRKWTSRPTTATPSAKRIPTPPKKYTDRAKSHRCLP